MLYREIMAVCSEIHTKHINTLCDFYNPDGVCLQRSTDWMYSAVPAVLSASLYQRPTPIAHYLHLTSIAKQLTATSLTIPLAPKPEAAHSAAISYHQL